MRQMKVFFKIIETRCFSGTACILHPRNYALVQKTSGLPLDLIANENDLSKMETDYSKMTVFKEKDLKDLLRSWFVLTTSSIDIFVRHSEKVSTYRKNFTVNVNVAVQTYPLE